MSIDFDYFQNVTKEQVSLYPDGIDNSTALSEIIWGNHYAEHGDELRTIGIMEDELETLERILLEQSHDVPVMIANSHKHIYDFICEHDDGKPMELINADMHHDIVNDNPELDCGNWVAHILNRQKENNQGCDFAWLANPISFDVFGIDDLFGKGGQLERAARTSFKEVEGEAFDLIYLCRSDIWTPPHLDKYFSELCDVIKSNFASIKIEKGIDKPRTQYLAQAKRIAGAIKKFSDKNERTD